MLWAGPAQHVDCELSRGKCVVRGQIPSVRRLPHCRHRRDAHVNYVCWNGHDCRDLSLGLNPASWPPNRFQCFQPHEVCPSLLQGCCSRCGCCGCQNCCLPCRLLLHRHHNHCLPCRFLLPCRIIGPDIVPSGKVLFHWPSDLHELQRWLLPGSRRTIELLSLRLRSVSRNFWRDLERLCCLLPGQVRILEWLLCVHNLRRRALPDG